MQRARQTVLISGLGKAMDRVISKMGGLRKDFVTDVKDVWTARRKGTALGHGGKTWHLAWNGQKTLVRRGNA